MAIERDASSTGMALARDALADSVRARSLDTGKPVVFMRLIRDPGRKRHVEIVAEGLGVALVKAAHLAQPLDGMTVTAHADSALAEQVMELVMAIGRQAIGGVR